MTKFLAGAITAAGLGAVALASSASAQTTTGTPPKFATIFTQDVFAIPSYTTAQTPFQNFANGTPGQQYVPAAGETKSGDVEIQAGNTPGMSAQPTGSGSNQYLDIVNGSYSVSFTTPVQFFSFIAGSLDSYNTVKLFFQNGATETLQGTQIIGLNDGNTVLNTPYDGRVSYDVGGGSGISSVLFSSTQAAFEIDSLVAAVPEAATWAMMLVGMGLVGGALRRRQTVKATVAVA